MEETCPTVVQVKKGSSQNEEPQILGTRRNSTMDGDYNSVVWIKEEPGCEEESLDDRDTEIMDGLNSSEIKSRKEKRSRKETKPHSSSYVKEESGATGVREVSPTTSDDELSLLTKEEPSFKEETIDDWDMELEEALNSAATNRELKLTGEGHEPYSYSDKERDPSTFYGHSYDAGIPEDSEDENLQSEDEEYDADMDLQEETVESSCSNGGLESRKAYRKFWTEFIRLYKENPCLWKVKSKEYSDRWKKTMAYGVLVEKLKEVDASANREMVTKKINSLRSSFRKELKKVASSRRSGATGNNVYQPNLWYYNLLLFLQDQETPQELSPSVSEELEGCSDARMCINDDNEDQDECQSITSQRSSAIPKRSCGPSRLRKRGHPDSSDDALTLIGDYLQSSCIDDECSIIGRNIAAKLRRLSEEQRIFAERLINEVLFRGRLDKLSLNTDIA